MKATASSRFARPFVAKSTALAGLILALLLKGGHDAHAQAQLRFTHFALDQGMVSLEWVGSAGFFEVQSTSSLADPDWERILRTRETSTKIRPSGGSEFFRVLTLPGWEERMVADGRRVEILDAVSQFIGTMPGTDGTADATNLVGFLGRFPELEGVNVAEDGSVVGRFTDGRPVIIINNRPPATDEELAGKINLGASPLPPGGASVRALQNAKQALATQPPAGIPESRRALLFEASVPGVRAQTRAALVPGFEARGYIDSGGEASLPNLMKVQDLGDDVGLLYVDSHGGIGVDSVAEPAPSGGRGLLRDKPTLAIMTSTHVTAESEVLYKTAFDQGELCYAITGPAIRVGHLVVTPKPHYCITSRFVKNRWRFGKRSLAYMDTCLSAHPGAASFIRACLANGASAYAGWTESVQDVWAFFATRVFFDTMLGGNPILTDISPKQRAFDRTAAYDYLKSKNWLVDATPPPEGRGARLVFFPDLPAPASFGLLAPSIRQMYAGSHPGVVNIYGLFDPATPATVRVEGGSTFEVMPQSRTELMVPWSGDSRPSAGNVTVFQREHRSNTIPLSEWRVKARMLNRLLAFRQEPRANIEFNLHVRADVHAFRLIPYGEAFVGSTSGIAEPDSTCRVLDASGVYDEGRVMFEWSLPAPVEVPWSWYFDPIGSSGFKGRITFKLDQGQVQFEAFATAADTATVTATPDEGDEYTYQSDPAGVWTHSGTGGAFDKSFTIQAGNDGSTAGARGPFGGRFSWDAAAPTFPPNPSIPGYSE